MKNRLKLLRVERGWTQEQMGQALGVSRQAVIALETERHDPSLDLAYRIAAVFERPVEEIFENPHAGLPKSQNNLTIGELTMMNVRSGARPMLRAVFLASAVALASGAGVAAARAETAAVAPFVSDRLSVEVVGAGPDVILIPGLASSREVWRTTADRLKATHRVHLVQLAGFAGQPWAHGDGAFVQPEVDELARYIREAGLDRPAVIGHSMGGLSGLLLAQQQPGLVGRVMTVDSLPFYSAMFGPTATAESARPFADQAAGMILGADVASFRTQQEATAKALSRTAGEQVRIVDWSMASDRHAVASAMKDVMTTDARPGLAAITTPVTALYAADADGGAPAAMADGMWSREYAALPGVTLIRVDGSRHFIMADQPERFAELVDAFLAK